MWAIYLHVSPSTAHRFSWKSCFSRERMVLRTHVHTSSKSKLALPHMQLLSPLIIMTNPAPSSLHLLVLLQSTPSHGRGQFKQMKEDDQTDGPRFPPRRKGHPKQGGESYRVRRNRRTSLPWVFWDGLVCHFKIVDYDGGSQRHPPRKRDIASSLDSPLSESISEAICCLLNGWGVDWCDWPQNISEVHVAIYSFHCRSWDCRGKLKIILFSMISFELYSPYFLKIVFESRKDSASLNDCLISVDGTDVHIP